MKNTVKKLLSLLLVLTMTVGIAPLSGFVGLDLPELDLSDIFDFNIKAKAYTDGYYTYTVSNNKATITDCDTSISGDVVIPKKLGAYTVIGIGSYAFNYCSNIKSITIPYTVTSVEAEAFKGCTSLRMITVDEDNKYFSNDSYGVLYNKNQKKIVSFPPRNSQINFVIPDSVTTIGAFAFSDCTSLTSIIIPDGVASIGYSAFEGCISLTSITIPDSVTTIGTSAFCNCTGLTELIMPVSAEIYNDKDTFGDCTNIEKITLTKGTGEMQNFTYWCSDDSGFTSYYQYTPWYISGCSEIIIEDGVTRIGSYAFKDCVSSKLTIPDSVTSIGDYAFQNCTSFKSVILAGVTSIGDGAFYGCTSLTSAVIPDGIQNIGYELFYNCTNLTSVTIPGSVTSIESFAFKNCTNLTSVLIPDSVSDIDLYAFSGCTNLKEVKIPISVKIDEKVFSDCNNIKKVIFSKGTGIMPDYSENSENFWCRANEVILEKGIKTIGEYAFNGYLFPNYNLTELTLPEGLTQINDHAFSYSFSSLTSLEIPSSVAEIGDGAFWLCDFENVHYYGNLETWCSIDFDDEYSNPMSNTENFYIDNKKLVNITIPNSVSVIKAYTFKGCETLKTVVIPTNVMEVYESAFEWCYNLETIYYEGTRSQWNKIKINESGTGTTFDYCEIVCLGHEHSYVGSITIPPSCTSIGIMTYKCSCGESYTDYLPAIGHSYKTVTTDATCETMGKTEVTCLTCGLKISETSIPAKGHTEVKDEAIAPTCTQSGLTEGSHCSVCGKVIKAQSVVPPTDHAKKTVTTGVTCETSGKTVVSCLHCGTILSETEVLPLGHTVVIDKAVAPTCTQSGLTEGSHCSACNKVMKDQSVIPATGHVLGDWIVTLEPTTTSSGIKTRYCETCKTAYQEQIIPPLPDEYSLSGTVMSFGSETDEILIIITKKGETEPVYSQTVVGTKAEYMFEKVATGYYTMTVTKKNHVTRTYDIAIGNINEILDIKIHLPGDTIGDGRINTVDVAIINSHAKGVKTLDGYQLACADVNGDGRVNTIDVSIVNSHAKGLSTLW